MSDPPDWREIIGTALLVFLIAFAGCLIAFAIWLQDLGAPGVTLLGSGNRLSVLVTDGPARLLLATGDDPIGYENALTRVRPIFARRVDVLFLAGADRSLLVPIAAHQDRHARLTNALAPLPPSPERDALGPVAAFTTPKQIQLGPAVRVTVETALPFAADPATTFPAWRATIERGETCIVVLSDGEAASLFPPSPPAAVLAISGADPVVGWELSPAVALIANAEVIGGPELRSALTAGRRAPRWVARVFPNEALRLRFVPGGVAFPPDSAQPLPATPGSALLPLWAVTGYCSVSAVPWGCGGQGSGAPAPFPGRRARHLHLRASSLQTHRMRGTPPRLRCRPECTRDLQVVVSHGTARRTTEVAPSSGMTRLAGHGTHGCARKRCPPA